MLVARRRLVTLAVSGKRDGEEDQAGGVRTWKRDFDG